MDQDRVVLRPARTRSRNTNLGPDQGRNNYRNQSRINNKSDQPQIYFSESFILLLVYNPKNCNLGPEPTQNENSGTGPGPITILKSQTNSDRSVWSCCGSQVSKDVKWFEFFIWCDESRLSHCSFLNPRKDHWKLWVVLVLQKNFKVIWIINWIILNQLINSNIKLKMGHSRIFLHIQVLEEISRKLKIQFSLGCNLGKIFFWYFDQVINTLNDPEQNNN